MMVNNMSPADYGILPGLYKRFLLKPLGLNSDNSLVFWLLLLAAFVMLGTLWLFQGKVLVTLAVLYVVGLVLLTFVKVDYSLYILMFTVLLFDQYGIPGFNPVTLRADFFKNLKEISYIPTFDAAVVNPIELHLLLIITSLVMLFILKKDLKWRPIPVYIPFIIFFAAFISSFLYGMKGGGDFMVALWEIRALFYFFIFYLIIPQIIRTKEQIQILVWIFIIGISIKAFQGIGRFVSLGFTTGGFETLTNHEDPVFSVTLFLLLLGFLIFRVNNKQRFVLILLMLPLLLGFYVGMRRAAYASCMVSLATFVLLMPPKTLIRFIKLSVPALIGIALYSAVFWNNTGRLGRPIQMIKSGFERPKIEESYKDYYSNLYRDYENYNLAQTVVNNPVFGTGFGQKYEQPIPLVYLTFPLRDYIPHNEIYWLIVKMGAVGFIAFWFFFNSYVAKAVKVLQKLKDPYLQVVLAVITVAIINQMVVSFFDLQLTYYRNMIYLGCLMGFLPAIIQYAKDEGDEAKEKTDEKTEEENKSE